MTSTSHLKFGVPIMKQAVSSGKLPGTTAIVRHQTGACGIEPYKPPPPPPPPVPTKLPDYLIRPPCQPGTQIGRFPPDCFNLKGFYCPPEKVKYKFPPFSENIDFIPTGDVECWWARPKICDLNINEEEFPIKI